MALSSAVITNACRQVRSEGEGEPDGLKQVPQKHMGLVGHPAPPLPYYKPTLPTSTARHIDLYNKAGA